MNKKKKVIILAAAFALLLLIASFGYKYLSGQKSDAQSGAAPTPSSSEEIAAPDFTVQDADGKAVSLSDFKGSPVVLNFWASWCPPCKSEMPDYEKMYQEYAPKGVIFMMVNLTDGKRETSATAKQFLKDKSYRFPAYFDVGLSASDTYGISSIPDSIFIDKNGNVRAAYRGKLDAASIRENIEMITK